MGSTYTWHPGTNGLVPVWSRPVPIYPDEIFSSWMVRAALKNGCDPLTLSGYLWPKWRIWTQDVDRRVPAERLVTLSQLSGISASVFQKTTLQPIAQQIFGTAIKRMATWPWILALGTRNTKRHSGMQYCPVCLAEDEEPYYRLQWRFAWHTVCEIHRISLHDQCWKCNAPLEFHRLAAQDTHIALCASCKADFREANQQLFFKDALQFQIEGDCSIQKRKATCLGYSLSTIDWFNAADFFISLIRRAGYSGAVSLKGLVEEVGTSTSIDSYSIKGKNIELIHVSDRQALLNLTWQFFSLTKPQLSSALRKFCITRQGLCGENKHIPEYLLSVMRDLPDRKKSRNRPLKTRKSGPRPRYEVQLMLDRLECKLKSGR